VLERNVATERILAIIDRENSLVMVARGRRVLELLGAVRPTDVALGRSHGARRRARV